MMQNSDKRSAFAYEKLAGELRSAILGDVYGPGERLPSETTLATTHGLSRQTVRRVLHKLASEGLVRTDQGRGTFVLQRDSTYRQQIGSILNLLALVPGTEVRVIDELGLRVSEHAVKKLGVDADHVLSVTFLRRLKDRPLCVFTMFFPADLEAEVRTWPFLQASKSWVEEEGDLTGHLDGQLQHPIVEAEQVVNAVPATRDVADALGVREGDPLLRIERIYFTADDRPVTLTVSSLTPELYTYRVLLRRDQV